MQIISKPHLVVVWNAIQIEFQQMFLSLDAVVAHIGLCHFHYSSAPHAGDIKSRDRGASEWLQAEWYGQQHR